MPVERFNKRDGKRVARRETSLHVSLHPGPGTCRGGHVPFGVYSYLRPFFFSDTQGSRGKEDRLLVRSQFRSRTSVEISRSLHAHCGPRATVDHHGVLLHEHLLGDLARYETSISYDVATCVSSRFCFLFWTLVNF